MVSVAGKTGTVDGSCNEVRNWSITCTTDMLDATDFCSSGWREFVAGLQGCTGTLESTERYVGGASITLANSAGGVSISGNVLFNEETITNDVEDIITYSQSFTFTGVVTIA